MSNREPGIEVLETAGRRRARAVMLAIAAASMFVFLGATAGAAWQKKQLMANPTALARARLIASPTTGVDAEIAVMLRDARASVETLKRLRDAGSASAGHALHHLQQELR